MQSRSGFTTQYKLAAKHVEAILVSFFTCNQNKRFALFAFMKHIQHLSLRRTRLVKNKHTFATSTALRACTTFATSTFSPLRPLQATRQSAFATQHPGLLSNPHMQSARMSTSSTSTTKEPLLVRFFDPAVYAKDARNRTLPTILSWPDRELEYNHDFIQTLFPLPESSMFASAPVINPAVHEAFATRTELRDSLAKALDRMLSFYGLALTTSPSPTYHKVGKADNFASASGNWLTRFNHNHLRLTRIIRSLRVLSLPSHASALYTFLSTDEEVVSVVGSKTQMYWRRAAERPLHLPPDEDDEGAEGITWLRKV